MPAPTEAARSTPATYEASRSKPAAIDASRSMPVSRKASRSMPGAIDISCSMPAASKVSQEWRDISGFCHGICKRVRSPLQRALPHPTIVYRSMLLYP
ncbi:jg22413 [Pararge aegeria aegeria]|uniref:Jg22413 protein n=1 Tax=Pararge aegeria aegeria TaxID=348720 RepID=A0A8S4RNI4_9NEOP|nr:jg22413 [Pararge aegeria aegeria]